MRLGIADEGWVGFERDVALGVAASARASGWETRTVATAADEARVDVVLAIGNLGIYPDLVRRHASARRILWHMEVLSIPPVDPTAIYRLHRRVPTGRLLDGAARALPPFGRSGVFARWREEAAIERETGANLRGLQASRRAFDRIVVDSNDRAWGARAAGIDVDVLPVGYHEAYAGPLASLGDAERDIEVLLLGSLPGRYGRRQRVLPLVEAGLAERGVTVTRLTTALMGPPRRAILDRTRVVVDIHRVPGNHPMLRFILATAAGAALVAEPLRDPSPLVAGVHYLEAPTGELPTVIAELLADEPARRRLVTASQALIAGPAHMDRIQPRLTATIVDT